MLKISLGTNHWGGKGRIARLKPKLFGRARNLARSHKSLCDVNHSFGCLPNLDEHSFTWLEVTPEFFVLPANLGRDPIHEALEPKILLRNPKFTPVALWYFKPSRARMLDEHSLI